MHLILANKNIVIKTTSFHQGEFSYSSRHDNMQCLFVSYLHNQIQNADSVLQLKSNIPVFIFKSRENRE